MEVDDEDCKDRSRLLWFELRYLFRYLITSRKRCAFREVSGRIEYAPRVLMVRLVSLGTAEFTSRFASAGAVRKTRPKLYAS